MVSRIDIGPDGGPYVAINENSNDLELQDINGNVIAVWDETEGQWDFKTNDLANVGGIDATGLTSSLDVGGNDLTNINAIDASSATLTDVLADSVSTGNARITTVSAINNAEPVDERIKIAKRTNINGTEIWSFSGFSDRVRSSPTVVDGVVYVGSDDNTLRAIDAVERFARLYVADSVGWIPLYRGPNEQPQVAGSTLTGNYSTQRETNQ